MSMAPPIENPMHPGEVLDELQLAPLDMSAGRLARFSRTTPRLRLAMQASWDAVHGVAGNGALGAIEPFEAA